MIQCILTKAVLTYKKVHLRSDKYKYEEEEKKEENFAPVEIILTLVEITLALVEIILALVEVSLALVETILALVYIIIVYPLFVDNSSSTQKAADSRNSRL